MQKLKEDIQKQWASNLPFVAYHSPNSGEVSCFFQKEAGLRYLQNYEESGFIFSPFEVNSRPIFFSEENSDVLKYELIDAEIDYVSKFSLKNTLSDKNKYIDLLQHTITAIKNEEYKKVVVSRVMTQDYTLENPQELLLKLIHFYPEAFTYVWFHPEIGLWAGASPEIFAKTYRTKFETMALAGTKRVNENREWTQKELDEQQIVTDEIVSALENHTQNVQVHPRTTDQAGDLFHLRTDISTDLDSSKLGLVLKDLHPTPAVCGLPKAKAYKFLKENEGYDRQFYTGFFGELNVAKQTQRSKRTRNQENQAYKSIVRASNLYVNLRCMSFNYGKVHVYVGGGITKDSIAEEEWTETVNKSRTMLKVL
ncbi:isochorismate synthase MenF [Psychroflexus gondwanensis ACAM 44]|jgi:isochorismate synthase|uniref:Isochorismate synthase MenF n=1 Tax=Psychroflexus gondwanensis ACAM 44 TaxID=1189619 RepID=N1WRU4_9FLAO|nr:chorismate-binding protein [Psychroflexus gondwanensis]EMY81740.1 isochorismate synthase MenF [Psychroflexus gondwanensis ACAM 44]